MSDNLRVKIQEGQVKSDNCSVTSYMLNILSRVTTQE